MKTIFVCNPYISHSSLNPLIFYEMTFKQGYGMKSAIQTDSTTELFQLPRCDTYQIRAYHHTVYCLHKILI